MNEVFISGGRSCGKSELWAQSLHSAIKARPDKKIIIGCTDQKLMLERLRKYFPNALFELVSTYGVSIHLRD